LPELDDELLELEEEDEEELLELLELDELLELPVAPQAVSANATTAAQLYRAIAFNKGLGCNAAITAILQGFY
jgi:hypothetical protein